VIRGDDEKDVDMAECGLAGLASRYLSGAQLSLAGGPVALGMYHPGEDRGFILQVRPEVMNSDIVAERAGVLQGLDVVALSDILLQGIFHLDHEQCVREHLITYFSDVNAALDAAVKKSVDDSESTPLLFLLNPTRVSQVTDVADQGEIMPHKSTYFYPKILTGLLINKLSDDGNKEQS